MSTESIEQLSQQEVARSAEAAKELLAARQERLSLVAQLDEAQKKIEAIQEKVRHHLRSVTIPLVRDIRSELKKVLVKGGEKTEVVRVLAEFSSLASQAHESLVRARAAFEDEPTLSFVSVAIREAGYLVAEISDLSQRAAKPGPALDLSKLSSNLEPVPKGQAPGFISLKEARSRLSK